MLTGVFQSVITLMTGLVFYVVDSWLMRHYDRQRAGEGSGRSWGYTTFMMAFLILLVLQPIVLPGLSLRIEGEWGYLLLGLGVALLLVGFLLHWWSRTHLGRFYVEDVIVQSGQCLVETGPYRLIRHPIFTSFFTIVQGLLLINPAVTTLALAAYVFVDFSRAACQEKGLLSGALPGYAEYMKRTGRFLPKWG